jgi:glycosyltransferase involved in cell wall biosynthesis
MYVTIDEVCDKIRSQAVQGRLSQALKSIIDFVIFVYTQDRSLARVFTSRELDLLCQELGASQALKTPSRYDQERTVYLVTQLSKSGGHSRVLRDLIAADPGSRNTILITNVLSYSEPDELRFLFPDDSVEIEVAPNIEYAERMRWIQERLYRLCPDRTYILQHHFDAISTAAIQPNLTNKLIYYHHGDHYLTLGAHVPHAIHVDLHSKGFFNCREREGIDGNVFWPLTVPDIPPRSERRFLGSGRLTTCSVGGPEKFDNSHLIGAIPYSVRYSEILPVILENTNGTHLHLGEISGRLRREILRNLRKAGISSERFIHYPWVSSISGTLVDENIDIYIGSFPRGGGRTVLEAMSCGMPLLVHSNYRSRFFSDADDVYPEAMTWRLPDELAEHLRNATPESLEAHAKKSREFYLMNHRPDLLRHAIGRTLSGGEAELPPRRVYRPNELQEFLDEGRRPAASEMIYRRLPSPLLMPLRNVRRALRAAARGLGPKFNR